MTSGDEQERLRLEAAGWFSRMRAPGADAHREAFETWRAVGAHAEAYARLERRFEESAILGHSRLAELRLGRTKSRRHQPAAGIIVALAACLAVAAALASLVWRGPETQTRFATGIGQIRTIALADGASMVLDTDSAATALTRGDRQIVRLERGRARFTAAKTDLAVTADQAEVKAKEASFDLALAPQAEVEITVLSGAPRLGRAGGLVLARYTPLPTGRQTLVGPNLTARRVQPASRVEAGWPSGLRRFDQAPLSEVAAITNRYNSRKIRFADPDLANLRLTGVFRVTGSESLAKALAAAFGLQVTVAPSGDLILSRASA